MKWGKKNLPRSRSQLEQFVKDHELHPAEVYSYKGRDILLAETDLALDRPLEYPWGYYQTAWFITRQDSKERFDGGSWVEFESMHDKEVGWTPEAKREARKMTALKQAHKWLDTLEEANA